MSGKKIGEKRKKREKQMREKKIRRREFLLKERRESKKLDNYMHGSRPLQRPVVNVNKEILEDNLNGLLELKNG